MNLQSAISAILATPDVTFLCTSAPGVGKTQGISAALAKTHHVILADCQNMQHEDMATLPVVKDGEVSFTSNKFWKPHASKPTAYILDELGKAIEPVRNALLPLLHGAPRRVMGYSLRPDDIVVVLSNDGSLRLGDEFKAHQYNRVVQLHIDSPTVPEALSTMTMLGFDARISSWVEKTPSALVSFDASVQKKADGENVGYFGLISSKPSQPFCSMRSLETASKLMKTQSASAHLAEQLAGVIGKAAAISLSHHLKDIGEFVDPRSMEQAPDECSIPKSVFDQRLAMLGLASHIGETNYKPLLKYLARYPEDMRFIAYKRMATRQDALDLMKIGPLAGKIAAAL